MLIKPQTKPDSGLLKEAVSAIDGAIPYWLRFMGAMWNFLVFLLKKVGLFPLFKKKPWLFFVLIFCVLGPLVPVGLILILLSLDDFNKQTWMAEDFVIHFGTQEEILESILRQARGKTPEPDDIYNAATKMGCPDPLANEIRFLYEERRMLTQDQT